MPTYEYVCDACAHAFEEYQAMSDAALKTCPKCRKKKLRRLIGAGGGLLFKGAGFYKTDYRPASYKAAAAGDSGTATPATGGTAKADGGGPGAGTTPKGGTDAKGGAAPTPATGAPKSGGDAKPAGGKSGGGKSGGGKKGASGG